MHCCLHNISWIPSVHIRQFCLLKEVLSWKWVSLVKKILLENLIFTFLWSCIHLTNVSHACNERSVLNFRCKVGANMCNSAIFSYAKAMVWVKRLGQLRTGFLTSTIDALCWKFFIILPIVLFIGRLSGPKHRQESKMHFCLSVYFHNRLQ